MNEEFRNAVRILNGPIASLEKRCLLWLAARIPRSINSDHLTALAVVSMFFTGVSYWLARSEPLALLAAIVWLAVNWFGDSLDGTLARVRRQQRPRYGFYIDHVVDTFGVVFLFGGLALSGYMSPYVALPLLVAYLALAIEVYLATYCLQTFRLTFFGFGPTELRLLLSIGNIAAFVRPTTTIFGHTWRLFDVGGVVGALGLALTLVYATINDTRALAKAEPRPPWGGAR